MKQPNYYHKMLTTLHKMKDICPTYTMGKHLSSIIEEVGDIWSVTDKELSLAMVKYAKQLCIDKPHPDKEIDRIIDEGLHLDKILIQDTYDEGDTYD